VSHVPRCCGTAHICVPVSGIACSLHGSSSTAERAWLALLMGDVHCSPVGTLAHAHFCMHAVTCMLKHASAESSTYFASPVDTVRTLVSTSVHVINTGDDLIPRSVRHAATLSADHMPGSTQCTPQI
jgi:hypothetical protein